MKFSSPLLAGKLLKRYKRFLADIELLDGQMITVHCPNPGSMESCQEVGWDVLLSDSQNPKRKLRYTWELVYNGQCWICINTQQANRLVEEALLKQEIAELASFSTLQKEVKYGDKSRVDFLLSAGQKRCFVEVKSVTLLRQGIYQFPDSVTKRGLQHLHELISQVRAGHRAVMFFLIQRSDGQLFKPAQNIDFAYAKGLQEAFNEGVEILCYQTRITPDEITLNKKVHFEL